MRTLNQKRDDKIAEVRAIRDLYPDLTRIEQCFMVLKKLEERALKTNDHTKRASHHEIGHGFEALFQQGPSGWINIQAQRLIRAIRKDNAHPHIRPYVHAYVETLVSGDEVVREYVELLFGKKAIDLVNLKLAGQMTGIKNAMKKNQELANARKVMKEADTWEQELEAKQQVANSQKRRKRVSA